MTRILLFLLYFTLPLYLFAQQKNGSFSLEEQQIINVNTPNLFSRTNTFEVDFTHIKDKEYSFPLPVGKVTGATTQAIEIETSKGDAVKSMFEGTVRLSRNTPNYGNVVVVRHNNGLETVYAFNAQNMVKVGDKVKAGQTIAIVGGLNGKIYCLFSIMVDGRKINPETILNSKSHHLRRQIVVFKKVGNNIDVTTKGLKKNAEGDANGESAQGNTSGKKQGNAGSKKGNDDELNFDPKTINVFSESSVYRLDLSTIKNWHYPLEGSHVISGYGGKRRHTGVDIKNAPNKEVYAAFSGVVIQSGVFSAYGKCITIAHANGLQTRYSHNSKNFVSVGDKVKAGDVIGLTGRTGRATTEHLHFETRLNDRPFDPAYIFDHANHALQKSTLQFKKGGSVTRLR